MSQIKDFFSIVLFRFSLLLFPLLFTGLLIGIIYFFVQKKKTKNELVGNSRYTIGTTEDIRSRVRASSIVIYNYVVNHKKYKGSSKYIDGIIVPYGRYIVEYSSNKPNISKIYFYIEIPDSIKKVPVDGWEEIPFKVF